MGLSEPHVKGVETAALLHDIGKLAVSEHILTKPGPLTQEEFEKIRIHPPGARVLTVVDAPFAPHVAGRPDERRRYARVAGPFDGRRVGALETPVLIYDLSEGGCFIIGFNDQEIGRQFDLKIDLPQDGWAIVKAETVYNRPGFGFAVRFIDVNEEPRARLARLVQRLGPQAAA
jgi:hypothetical protein